MGITDINEINETDTIGDIDEYVRQVEKFLNEYDEIRKENESKIRKHENDIIYTTMKDNHEKLEKVIDEYMILYNAEEKKANGTGNYNINYYTYNTLEDLYNDKKTWGDGNIEGMKNALNTYIGWYCGVINAMNIYYKDKYGGIGRDNIRLLITNNISFLSSYSKYKSTLEHNLKKLHFYNFLKKQKLETLLNKLEETKTKYQAFITDISVKYIKGVDCKYSYIKDIQSNHSAYVPSPQEPTQNTQHTSAYGALYKGGSPKIKKTTKKDVLGKERCIYKISGDRKEYVKYKGGLITLKDYKNIMKKKK
jgi:hypothetical protein